MQSLFAFDQCKEANHELALDLIDKKFEPDLNSMEVQDKDLLKKQRKNARQIFERKYKGLEVDIDGEKEMSAANEALQLFKLQVKKDEDFLSRNILMEIERLSQLYHSVLTLLIRFSELATAEKKVNHSNFYNNQLIKAISLNEDLKKISLRTNVGWEKDIDAVRGWFREVIKHDSTYIEFISKKSTDDEDQKSIVKHIVRKLILGATPINDYFEEQDIRWAEDKTIIKSLVDKTIKSYSDGYVELQKLSLDWEDDKLFIDKLFKNSVHLDDRYKALIAKNTKNWEVERLPLTDRVILEMAIAEMIHFPNIPIKVTINEYIELAKEYSTPKSRQFINGILDVLAKTLMDSGDVKKSGRGLLDNK